MNRSFTVDCFSKIITNVIGKINVIDAIVKKETAKNFYQFSVAQRRLKLEKSADMTELLGLHIVSVQRDVIVFRFLCFSLHLYQTA